MEKIENLEQASWAFRKMKEAEDEIAKIDEFAKMEIDRINKWAENEKKSHESSIEWFTFLINSYYAEERAKNSKFNLSTPWGKVTSRKNTKFTYEDDKVINYLKNHHMDKFIRVKEEVNKAELKKAVNVANGMAFDENGEAIDGIVVTEEQSVKVVTA